MIAILALVTEVVANLPQLIELGVNVTDLVTKTRAVIAENGPPGDAEWAALDKQVSDLQARLNADPQ